MAWLLHCALLHSLALSVVPDDDCYFSATRHSMWLEMVAQSSLSLSLSSVSNILKFPTTYYDTDTCC